MADHEIWKSIPGHKGYEASNLGRIRSIERLIVGKDGLKRVFKGKVLHFSIAKSGGYHVVNLWGLKTVHHLVAITFIGDVPPGMHVCHTNGIPTDDRPCNLRIDTVKGNSADTVRLGKSTRGERQPNSKLTAEQVLAIRKSAAHPRQECTKYSISEATVRDIRTGKRWGWLRDAKDTQKK